MAAGGVGASSGGRLGADGADEASWTFFDVFRRFLCIVLGFSGFPNFPGCPFRVHLGSLPRGHHSRHASLGVL